MTNHIMPPTSEKKPAQFAFVLSEAEQQMLSDLAEKEEMTKAALLRFWIRSEYLKVFGSRRPGAQIDATVRAVLTDIAGPVHYFAGNIAKRAGVTAKIVNAVLERIVLKTKGGKKILECVDHRGKSGEQWTWELFVPLDEAIAVLEKLGFPVDEPFVQVNPDADVDR